jgi:hypothetical protein
LVAIGGKNAELPFCFGNAALGRYSYFAVEPIDIADWLRQKEKGKRQT